MLESQVFHDVVAIFAVRLQLCCIPKQSPFIQETKQKPKKHEVSNDIFHLCS